MLSIRSRRSQATLVLLLLWVFGTASWLCAFEAVGQPIVLDKNSSFFRELLARPVPDDLAQLVTIGYVFNGAGLHNEGYRLHEWADRRRTKELLGEPLDLPPTVASAAHSRRGSIRASLVVN